MSREATLLFLFLLYLFFSFMELVRFIIFRNSNINKI
jgi:hypothetical protein